MQIQITNIFCRCLKRICKLPLKVFIMFRNVFFSWRIKFSKIKNNKIVFCQWLGNGYGCNPKYIAEELKKYNNLDLVWLVKNKLEIKESIPEFIRCVEYGSKAALYELATAKIWIDNQHQFFGPVKKKGQIYIETWHGDLPIKKIEYDNEQVVLEKNYQELMLRDQSYIDYFISGSVFFNKLIRNAFRYRGKILEYGIPRNDILFRKDDAFVCAFKKKFNIPKESLLVLYAPTYRSSNDFKGADLDFKKISCVLEKKYKQPVYILFRLHPNDSIRKDYKINDSVIDLSDYMDMQELVFVSDLLITDYSSCMYDFMLMNKPVFLFCPDLDEYEKSVGLYYSIRETPFCLSETIELLYENLGNYNFSRSVLDMYEITKKRFGVFSDGKSSERVALFIMQLIRGCENG